ncbi:uncharacterized protein G2W53_042289 [Senna tora]|uniref:Uncharacterized protein n=1 Tax=Senna tora TaxID=362788 RepID=A0A834VYV9_9FABA|nr:uncharacterized protein G2W53_042289 [Senna tora]
MQVQRIQRMGEYKEDTNGASGCIFSGSNGDCGAWFDRSGTEANTQNYTTQGEFDALEP